MTGIVEWLVTAAGAGVFGLLVGAALIPPVEHIAAPALKGLKGMWGKRVREAVSED